MDKVSRKIWWIATPALLAALLFQLYWLRQTYRSQQEAFVATATEAFHSAYDHSIIITARLRAGVEPKEKRRYSIQTTIDLDESGNTQSAGVPRAKRVIRYDTSPGGLPPIGPKDIHIDSTMANQQMRLDETPPSLAHFVSTIFSSFTDVVPDKDTLRKYYRSELSQKEIPLAFSIQTNSKEIDTVNKRPSLIIRPGLNKPDHLIGVSFEGLPGYLLKKMGSAIILSVFIAFLITGCIWTLWRIILRQEKLERMKREFMSHVTHELKTPVSILQATNEALLSFQGMHDAEKTARYLRHSRAELNRLQDLIDKIMQVSREEQEQQALHITETDIGTLIDESINRFGHLPQVSIKQHVEIANTRLYTDVAAFTTILTNLIDNAVKYNDKPLREVLIAAKEHPEYYTFSVKDNGNGIEKQHFPFLYDKFYRIVQGDTHDTKGYGLGLSHVKALLLQLNGSITVTSTPGNGSTFTFQLPKYEKDQTTAG
jgi:signal transduction histidine kinase